MAYQIDRYNNTLLTVVEDGTVDQTTDLKFIGKNYAGYGEIQNENFLFLLENFSGPAQPPKPVSGQVWFDSVNSKLKFYDGGQWRTTGGSEISTTEPTGLSIGDFWWNTADDQLYAFNGTSYILIGPQNAGTGVTQMQSIEVLDTFGASRSLITGTIGDEVVHVISAVAFILGLTTPIPGFTNIAKGLTLQSTDNNGVSSNDFRYWGTASNADRLGGVLADDYITRNSTSFDSLVAFPDPGLTIGDTQDLQLLIENGNEGIIQNVTGQNSVIKIKTTGTNGLIHSFTFNATGLIPNSDNTFNIGSTTRKLQNIHAVNFFGTASSATQLKVGTDSRNASVSDTPNTVAVRDTSGNLAANLFQGTATRARYADLAEIYSTNKQYAIGTVMSVCSHRLHETCAANAGEIAIGVISEKPAYLMNSAAEGQAIGLKGRVPVRVVGAVKKGQAVYVHCNGTACTFHTGSSIVGIALESSDVDGEKLVECVLKV